MKKESPKLQLEDGSIERDLVTQEEQHRKDCETTCVDDDNRTVEINVDVNSSISDMAKLSLNAREVQGAGQEEPRPSKECTQAEVSIDVSNLSNEKGSDEQSSITRKPAAWRTPKPKARVVSEAEFIMEASSWPTLAEARHAKPSEAGLSLSQKETISVSSHPQKVPLSQENSMEPTSTNPPSKYRSSYSRKGSYGKPNFSATENIPVPVMGVPVLSTNMFYVDHSRKGVGVKNFFPGLATFPHHRGEGLAPFPHNSVVPHYGRGPPRFHHHGGGYSDASYNHPGFVPSYDQQQIDPWNMHPPPMAPWHYHYPTIPGHMSSYMPPAFSPSDTPYYGPSRPPRGITQGFDFRTMLAMVQSQIEYYFSNENLIRDIYLTSKMDEEGFVPVSLIAGFPRVNNLTSNSMHIFEALKNSSIVEVKNGKLRSREWRIRSSGTSTLLRA